MVETRGTYSWLRLLNLDYEHTHDLDYYTVEQ